jgi:hypothetical protein
MCTLAIALLNRTRGAYHHHVTITILTAGASAAAFALFDVLVQKWSPSWGVGRFLPAMIGFVVIYSCFLIPRFPTISIEGRAWPWLLGGSVVLGVQSLMFVGSVAYFRQATAANIMYSSRGLWSVVLVWLIGHWFHNSERSLGAAILGWRLVGAALMLVAIALVLF